MFKLIIVVLGISAIGAYVIKNYKAPDPKPEVKVVTKVVTNPGVPMSIRVFHDEKRGVTCYLKEHSASSALSCVPDIQLRISQ